MSTAPISTDQATSSPVSPTSPSSPLSASRKQKAAAPTNALSGDEKLRKKALLEANFCVGAQPGVTMRLRRSAVKKHMTPLNPVDDILLVARASSNGGATESAAAGTISKPQQQIATTTFSPLQSMCQALTRTAKETWASARPFPPPNMLATADALQQRLDYHRVMKRDFDATDFTIEFSEKRSTLTAQQMHRVENLHHVFRDHLPNFETLEKSVQSFEACSTPDNDLLSFELMSEFFDLASRILPLMLQPPSKQVVLPSQSGSFTDTWYHRLVCSKETNKVPSWNDLPQELWPTHTDSQQLLFCILQQDLSDELPEATHPNPYRSACACAYQMVIRKRMKQQSAIRFTDVLKMRQAASQSQKKKPNRKTRMKIVQILEEAKEKADREKKEKSEAAKGIFPPAKATCAYCGKTVPVTELKRCGRCRSVSYCSQSCQVAHWSAPGGHKTKCQPQQSTSTAPQASDAPSSPSPASDGVKEAVAAEISPTQ